MIDLSRQYYLSVTWQVMHPEMYGEPWSHQMVAKFSAARSFAGDTAMFVTNKAMELMGSYGYAFEMNLEKYYRDFKIVQMWLGGAQRDRLDIAQGLYGPFKWAGYEEWLKKRLAAENDPIERTINNTMIKATGSEREAEKIRKELKKDMEYDIEKAKKEVWGLRENIKLCFFIKLSRKFLDCIFHRTT